MDLKKVAEYLQQQGLGQMGQNLFVYAMPESIASGLLVTSQMPIRRDKYLQDKYTGEFQVIARGSAEDQLIDELERVSNALNTQGLKLGAMDFRYIFPKQAPLVFPRAESHLLEASINFEFIYFTSV